MDLKTKGEDKVNTIKMYILLGLVALLSFGCHDGSKRDWDECTLSSNWHGNNASQRMMNILSPHMPDSVFNERLSFIKSRDCNTVHLILCNRGDGEYCRYSIYGNSITWNIDKNYVSKMNDRIIKLYKQGFGIVLWLVTDDSGDWNRKLATNFGKYVQDINSLGWFDYASTVVLGLELDDYWNANQVSNNMNELRKVYKGKTGVHMTSGKWEWVGVADILFYQVPPGMSAKEILNETRNIKTRIGGKPMNFFELSRQEDRALCQSALDGGAYAVGNW